MRHSDRPVQLPRSASGNRLCRHRIAGGCGWWCSYKLFAKVIVGTVVGLAAICGGVLLTGSEGEQRVREVLYGVGAYLALVIPGIIWTNRRDSE
jgi:hypothetical protein